MILNWHIEARDNQSMNSHFMVDGVETADVTLVLAHGAGASMDSPFMQTIAQGLAASCIRVIRFEFPTCVGGARPARKPRLTQRQF